MTEIQRQLHARPIFVIILSPAALHRSQWVANECRWAFQLLQRDAGRMMIPVTAAPLTADDFYPDWLYLEGYKRVEATGMQPFPPQEAARRTHAALPRDVSPLSPHGNAPGASAPAPLSAHGDGVPTGGLGRG